MLINISVRRPEINQRQMQTCLTPFVMWNVYVALISIYMVRDTLTLLIPKSKSGLENGKEKSEEDLKIKNKIRLPIKKINKPKQIWGGYSRCYLRKFQRTILCSFTQGQTRPNTTHFSWVEVGLSPPAFHFNCFISTYLAKITDFRSTNTLPPV